jgi:SNF2 family DNA or RNA helicase
MKSSRGYEPTAEELAKEWVPEAYMLSAMRFMLERGSAGLFLDPGLRKTSITLAVAKTLKKRHGRFPFLVVAPLRVCQLVWPAERAKWRQFHGLSMEVLHGPKKGEALRRKADVYVINPEGLEWLFEELRGMDEWPFEALVVDESTKFKRASSGRSKLLRAYLPHFRRRYILTGTPAPNGLLDLFGQVMILDLGNALGRYITHYRREYFLPTGYGGYTWVPQEDGERRIYRRLEKLVLRMDAKDYLKLPPLVGVEPQLVIEVDLPPAARKAYDEMEEDLIAKVEGGVVTASNAAVASMKCRQIANGGIYEDRQNVRWKKVHDAKTDAILELVESLQGQPLLVATDFRHDEERLLRALPKGTPAFSGGKSAKEVRRIEAAWNAGDLPVLLANPQSAAWGLNLQEHGRAVAWHSLTWDLELYLQFIRRVWRSGQKGRVFVHHVAARDTVDQALLKAVRKKDKTQGALLSALRDYARARRVRRA